MYIRGVESSFAIIAIANSWIVDRDTAGALVFLEELAEQGQDLARLVTDLLEHLRHLLLVQHMGHVPDSLPVTDETRDRLRRFEAVREAYLKEQEELRKKLRGAATEAERDRVRELIRQTRQEWLDRMRQLREESARRIRELPSVMPDMREVLSNARENARDAALEVRKRRGQD